MIWSFESNKPPPSQVAFGDGVCHNNKWETIHLVFIYEKQFGYSNFLNIFFKKLVKPLPHGVSASRIVIQGCDTPYFLPLGRVPKFFLLEDSRIFS